ncbi:MAG: hypothetical protein ACI9GW_002649 [Halieaceae bacterium]|jgi:hypothetical protein
MLTEVFRAIFLGALPVMVFSFAILQWSITTGRMQKFTGEDGLATQHARHAKSVGKTGRPKDTSFIEQLSDERSRGDIFHGKLMSFGGGYYGTMAILTYLLIEVVEIWQFMVQALSPNTSFGEIGLGLVIEFFVNSLLNLIAAFIWFMTLPEYINISEGLVWLGASYLGYLAGLRLTADRGSEIEGGAIQFWTRFVSLFKSD